MSSARPDTSEDGRLILRLASPYEADGLSELAVRSKAYWGYSAAFLAACRAELTVTAEAIDAGGIDYVVAERSSQVEGFYGLSVNTDGRYELEALFVEPAHIGTGVGRCLMRHAMEAVAARRGRCLVIQGDPNARGFYQAVGGEQVGLMESASVPGRYLPVFEVRIPAARDVADEV